MARNTIACKSLLSIRRRISGTDVVPSVEQAAAAVDEFLQLFAGVFSRKQRSISGPGGSVPARSGETAPAPLRALKVSITRPWRCARDGDAASHVRDDQVQLFVFPTRFAGVPACDGLLVEGVEDRFARQLGQSRNACGEIIRPPRIGDMRLDFFDPRLRSPVRHPAQIRGVLPPGVEQVVVQCVVHLVDPPSTGCTSPPRPMTAERGADVESAFAQRFEKHEVFPPFELVADRREARRSPAASVDRQRKGRAAYLRETAIFVEVEPGLIARMMLSSWSGCVLSVRSGLPSVSRQPGRPVRWSTSWSRRESPREVSTQGTFVPMTMAASSPPKMRGCLEEDVGRFDVGEEQAVGIARDGRTLDFCARRPCRALRPATAAVDDRIAQLSAVAHFGQDGPFGRRRNARQHLFRGVRCRRFFGVSMPSSLAVWMRYPISFCFCLKSGCGDHRDVRDAEQFGKRRHFENGHVAQHALGRGKTRILVQDAAHVFVGRDESLHQDVGVAPRRPRRPAARS